MLLLAIASSALSGCKDTFEVGERPLLEAEPSLTEFNLDGLQNGESETRTVVVRNKGNKDVTIDALQIEVGNDGIPSFALAAAPSLPVVLTPDETVDIAVAFTRYDGIERQARLVVISDAPDVSAQLAAVQGRPWLVTFPSVVVFAGVAEGSEDIQPLEIGNTGARDLAVTRVELTSDAAFSVGHGDTWTDGEPLIFDPPLVLGQDELMVKFAPTSDRAHQGNLRFWGDGGNALIGHDVPLQGNESGPCILVNPPRVNFGHKPPGGTYTITVDVQSCGNEPLVISDAFLATSAQAATSELSALGVQGSSPRFSLSFAGLTDTGLAPTAASPWVLPANASGSFAVTYVTPPGAAAQLGEVPTEFDIGSIVLETNAFRRFFSVEVAGATRPDPISCGWCDVEVAGIAGQGCSGTPYLAVPSSKGNGITVFEIDTLPPRVAMGSPFATCEDPSRMVVDSDGTMYVSCRKGGRVNKHLIDGTLEWSVQLPESDVVRGAILGPGGRLFVGCFSTGNVYELNTDTGAIIATLVNSVGIYGLAVDAEAVYATTFRQGLFRINISTPGQLSVDWMIDPAFGYGIATDDAGSLWVSTFDGLARYDTDTGTLLDVVSLNLSESQTAPSEDCNGVTTGLDGRVYVACGDNDRFYIYDPLLNEYWVRQLPPGASHARGLSVDASNNIYTINRFSNNITRFDAETGLALNFGEDLVDEPYAYSGDLTSLNTCLFGASSTTWESPVVELDGPTLWRSIRWDATVPTGTSVRVWAQLDGGEFEELTNGQVLNQTATTLQLRAWLSPGVGDAVPIIHRFAVAYDP